jgi:protein-S-isoprenylcysteine O-methyltransferase Ste14
LKLFKIINKIAALIVLMLISHQTFAADMADTMRSEGKIWVVVAVLVTIMLGLIIYLITIDKKISTIEKELDSSKKQ